MPPPPWRRLGGGRGLRAPPGGARTRVLLGALAASRALVREIASGGVCARLASPARPGTPPKSRPRPAVRAAATPAVRIWRCFRHAWERKSRHVETRARAPRRADALPMRAGATHGDNWARAHIPRRRQRRRWHCATACRRGGRGRRPSRWRSCSGLADCGGYHGRAT